MVTEKDYMRNIEKMLTDSRISRANREILKKYNDQGQFQQVSMGTRAVRLNVIHQLALFVEKNFKDLTKEDIENFVSSRGEWQPKTWSTNGAYIKFFFKWLYNSDEYPPNVKWIKTSVKSKNRKLPSDLLTKDEIKMMVEAADNPMEKAFIMVLYESACRIGEILSLKIKDVTCDQYGCTIIVNGKTGMRRIRLIVSSPDLVLWINNHPKKQDRESPLFIQLINNNGQYGKELNHVSASSLIKKLAQRVGIKKHVHPHLFRHSRLTELAKDFSESELKIIAGWTGSSNMAGVYVHLSGGDIERKMLRKNGLLDKVDDPEKDTLKPKNCPRCREINPNTARFCYVCGMVLDAKPSVEIDVVSDKDIENKMIKAHGVELEPKESQNEIISKGLLQYIIKQHPELVFEFLKDYGLDSSLLTARNSGNGKAIALANIP